MSGLNLLPWLALLALVALYWWQSGVYKGRARELAQAHCRELGLQLRRSRILESGPVAE